MLKNLIKKWFNLYEIKDLTTIGNCGCCGSRIENQILPKLWPYGICKKCINSPDT